MSNQAPWHPGLYHKGQTLYWLPSDTQAHFEKNISDPVKRDYLEQQGWLDLRAIEYKINEHGFRSDQFVDDQPCMIALGCSFTVGIGLPQHQVWPWLVGQELDLPVYNLAWGGASADTCFRLADYWIPRLNSQVVCMLTPPAGRFELLPGPGPWPAAEVIMPNSSGILENITNDTFVKHWYINDLNSQLNAKKNKFAIETIVRNVGAKLAIFDVETDQSMIPDIYGYARDYLHTGPLGHQVLAAKMLEQLNKQNV